MNALQKINRWHHTTPGLAAFALLEVGLAYLSASWAIDSGSLLAYSLTLILVIGVGRNFYLLGKGLLHAAKA